MVRHGMLCAMLLVSFSVAQSKDPVLVFMEDGQLLSHPIRIFVSADIAASHAPELKFSTLPQTFKPAVVAQNQKTIQKINNFEQEISGTLLIFDLRGVSIPLLQPMMSVYPTISWKTYYDDRLIPKSAGALQEAYLGNAVGAAFWSLIVLALFMVLVVMVSQKKLYQIVLSTEGRLCLGKIQLIAWTLLIGTIVFCFSLIRFDVSPIPDSLVCLLAISLATSALNYYSTVKQSKTNSGSPVGIAQSSGVTPVVAQQSATVIDNTIKLRFRDLIADYQDNGQETISLLRVQMVFWSGIVMVLFVLKSFLTGQPWDVPWQMVVLLGLSYSAYLAPKFSPKGLTVRG
ncbi:MAG: hypothetical protein JW795_16950 [Chitinivibrionales bacterium]|nr:hypothetical protein [Chitinivibrionales bacterium]